MKRLAIPSSAVLLFTLLYATPALAAAPSNDTYAGRTVVAGIPYAETLDTTEATTDADDMELNSSCGAPATDASVWYEYAPDADRLVLVDVSASDYPAGVLVGIGSPGSLETVTCGPGGVAFFAEAGTTYVLLIIDDQSDTSGNGGILELTIGEAPPPPEVDITLDPTGTFNSKTGSATITGTITCTADAFAFIDATVRQAVGRFTVSGFGFTEVLCDGSTQAWSIEVVGETGQFKGGKAEAVAFGSACSFDCGFDAEEATIRLRK